MRMAANLDEIIKTADEVYREPANHKNAEAFNRGKIKIQVGENAYKADVLTAIRPDTREIFYDLVNIAKTKIEPSGGTHEEPDGSRSRLPDGSKKNIAQNDAPVKKNTFPRMRGDAPSIVSRTLGFADFSPHTRG